MNNVIKLRAYRNVKINGQRIDLYVKSVLANFKCGHIDINRLDMVRTERIMLIRFKGLKAGEEFFLFKLELDSSIWQYVV